MVQQFRATLVFLYVILFRNETVQFIWTVSTDAFPRPDFIYSGRALTLEEHAQTFTLLNTFVSRTDSTRGTTIPTAGSDEVFHTRTISLKRAAVPTALFSPVQYSIRSTDSKDIYPHSEVRVQTVQVLTAGYWQSLLSPLSCLDTRHEGGRHVAPSLAIFSPLPVRRGYWCSYGIITVHIPTYQPFLHCCF